MTDPVDILFVAETTPDEELFKTISYPWHQVAADIARMGFRVRVCAPVKLVGLSQILKQVLSIGQPKEYSVRMTPSFWTSLFPRWEMVGGVQTLIADRRLYKGLIKGACRSAGNLHFASVADFQKCHRLLGGELFSMKYVITPRRSCLSNRGRMGLLWDDMFKHAAAVAYPSESVRRKYVRKSLQYDGRVINHGINPVWYDTPRSAAVVPRDTVSLVTACGLTRDKGIARLVKAVGANEGLKLTVIGDGPYRAELEKLARSVCRPGQCLFAGWLSAERMIPWYDKSDIFVLPSPKETMGLVYWEALARRRPIIGITNQGIHGMLPGCKNARFMSLVFGPGDLSVAVKDLMQSGPFDSCQCGQCSVRRDHEAAAKEFAGLYASLEHSRR